MPRRFCRRSEDVDRVLVGAGEAGLQVEGASAPAPALAEDRAEVLLDGVVRRVVHVVVRTAGVDVVDAGARRDAAGPLHVEHRFEAGVLTGSRLRDARVRDERHRDRGRGERARAERVDVALSDARDTDDGDGHAGAGDRHPADARSCTREAAS